MITIELVARMTGCFFLLQFFKIHLNRLIKITLTVSPQCLNKFTVCRMRYTIKTALTTYPKLYHKRNFSPITYIDFSAYLERAEISTPTKRTLILTHDPSTLIHWL